MSPLGSLGGESDGRETGVLLRGLVDRYALAVDRLDLDGGAGLFTTQGVLQVPATPGGLASDAERRGRGAIAAALRGLDRYCSTLHAVVGQVIEPPEKPNLAGRCRGVTSCEAHHISAEGSRLRDRVMGIRYHDDYAIEDGEWRFAARRLVVLWTAERSVNAVLDRAGQWRTAGS